MSKAVRILIICALFTVSLALVVVGQRQIGIAGLSLMLLGLAGLLGLLWYYNRQYR